MYDTERPAGFQDADIEAAGLAAQADRMSACPHEDVTRLEADLPFAVYRCHDCGGSVSDDQIGGN